MGCFAFVVVVVVVVVVVLVVVVVVVCVCVFWRRKLQEQSVDMREMSRTRLHNVKLTKNQYKIKKITTKGYDVKVGRWI
jgi:septation ring formation regulator EzrA